MGKWGKQVDRVLGRDGKETVTEAAGAVRKGVGTSGNGTRAQGKGVMRHSSFF